MPFLAPVGAAIAGGFAAASGAAAVLSPILTVGAGVAGIAAATGSRTSLPSFESRPALPDPAKIYAQETAGILRANQKRTKTILTSPLGVTDQTKNGTILKKTLGGS
jgi:hypothetical protein